MHPNLFQQINQWIVKTPLRSLSEAHNAALAIRTIEAKHFVKQPLRQPLRTSLLSHLPSLPRSCWQQLGLAGMGVLSALFTAIPTKAAETISFVYSPFQTSLSVQSLDEFASTGRVNADLDFLFRLARVSETAKAELRQALVGRAAIDPILPSRFFYSGVGEDVLDHMGRYIATP